MNRIFLPALAILLLGVIPLAAQPVLSITQPTGPGSFQLSVSGVGNNAELMNLISLFPYNPTGGGPLFGLGLNGSNLIVDQMLMPVPSPPFRVLATGTTYDFAFALGAVGFQIPIDAVTVEWNPATGVVAVSNVVNVTLDF